MIQYVRPYTVKSHKAWERNELYNPTLNGLLTWIDTRSVE